MKERDRKSKIEPRWPVALTLILIILLNYALPSRIALFPAWIAYPIGLIMLFPILMVGITSGSPKWLKIEKIILHSAAILIGLSNCVNLTRLTESMIMNTQDVSGIVLLTSSIAIWALNVMIFSLIYWQLDRGGPESRITGGEKLPSWLFPQDSAPEGTIPTGWRPQFPDYLYLSYSTATAFSTTEVAPVTIRAKMLMMLESLISLVTILMVAARAINILT